MEAIVLLFAGIAEAMVLLTGGFAGLIVGVISLVLELLGWAVSGVVRDLSPHAPPSHRAAYSLASCRPSKRLRKEGVPPWVRWAARIAGILCLLGSILVLLAETVLFDATLRLAASLQEPYSGVSVSFDQAEGSFFRRTFTLQDVHFHREASQGQTGLDLRVERLEAAFRGFVLAVPDRMSHLVVTGLQGRIDLVERSEEPVRLEETVLAFLNRRPFTIEDLRVEGCDLELAMPGGEETVPMTVEAWHSRPVRVHLLGFDLLFRSNLSGTIGEAAFSIHYSEHQGERKTEWRLQNLQVEVLHALAGAPWTLFESATVDLQVADAWSLEKGEEFIEMNWNIRLREVRLAERAGGTGLRSLTEQVFRRYIQSRMGEEGLELGFTLRIRDGQFEGTVTEALKNMWEAAFVVWLREKTGLDVEKAEEVKGNLKSFGLELRKKLKKQEPPQ